MQYRRVLADTVGIDPGRMQLFAARPQQVDVSVLGVHCPTVLAIALPLSSVGNVCTVPFSIVGPLKPAGKLCMSCMVVSLHPPFLTTLRTMWVTGSSCCLARRLWFAPGQVVGWSPRHIAAWSLGSAKPTA